MIASGGLSGGISSAIAGGNFWDGVRQGLITTGLNHAAHGMLKGGNQQQGKANSRDNTKSVGVMQSDLNTLGSGGRQSGYQLADGFGQLMNAGGVVYGGAKMGLHAIGRGNGVQAIGNTLGFGMQQTAQALRGTLGVVGKVGTGLGVAGVALSTVSYVGQGLDPNSTISTATHVNFWTSTVLYGTAAIVGGPVIGGAALIYGAAQLGSYMFTGNTLEENILGK